MVSATTQAVRETSSRRAPTLIRDLIVLSVVGSALLQPPFELAFNLAAVDIVLGFLLLVGWRSVAVRGPASRLAGQVAPWFYLYFVGHVIGLWSAGFTGEVLAATARNLSPVVVFLVLVGLLSRRPAVVQVALKAFVVTGLVVAASVLLDGSNRSEGLFANPNYAAHFMACAALLVPYLGLSRTVSGGVYFGLLVGMLRTGSFGGVVILLTAVAAAAWRRCGLAPRKLRGVLRTVVVLAVALVGWIGWQQFDGAEVDAGSGLSSERFDRSSNTRFELWRDGIELFRANPQGIGARGIESQELEITLGVDELHNDVLDTLVAGGVPALVGMVGMVAVIWRAAGPNSRLRVAVAGLVATSAVRQTWNFRHMWIFLALALAVELHARRNPTT